MLITPKLNNTLEDYLIYFNNLIGPQLSVSLCVCVCVCVADYLEIVIHMLEMFSEKI